MASQHELPDDARMPFLEHLRELRTRLRNSVIALIIGFGVAYAFKEHIVGFLLMPVVKAWVSQQQSNPALGAPSLYYTELIGPFWAYLSLSLLAGIFFASPLVFHQIWQFIAPGLYKHEQRYGIAFATVSAICFIGGALFCYYLVLPMAFDFFLGYSTDDLAQITHTVDGEQITTSVGLRPIPTIDKYLSLERKLLIGFGLVFELPLVIFFLSLVGAVSHRGLWRFNRWWIVIAFILSAALTPPDVFSQTMMAGPLIVLYNLSIGIAFLMTKRREHREARLDAGGD